MMMQIVHFRYFNPRSREGSDDQDFKLFIYDYDISIHAPAKGATYPFKFLAMTIRYFNPRSREGSDFFSQNFLHRQREFQSTLPRRERRNMARDKIIVTIISIHAPAKGATHGHRILATGNADFNPRSREGSDSNIIQQISFSLYNTVYFVSNNIK